MRQLRPVWLLVPALSLGLLAGACSSSSKSSSAAGGTTASSTGSKLAAVTLNASGSSFQKNFEDAAIEGFHKVQPAVTINYGGGGSGKGKTDLQGQVVDFAGTDSLIKDAERAAYKGGDVLYFPLVAAPITVSYNLANVSDLTLDGPTLAQIFLRKIKTWNDPAIVRLNPTAKLTATNITVAVRQDSSGTSENFTKYLKAAAPTDFTIDAGPQPSWPTDVTKGPQNTGVAGIVKQTNGAIGYVDFADAHAAQLVYAKVVNKAGKAVAPSLDGTSAALAQTPLGADLTYNPLNADGDAAYPISSPTWIIAYKNQTDKAKGQALKAYLSYIYGEGQNLANDNDFAKLPDKYLQPCQAQVAQLQVPA
jgi:phosphate transport system substrate-binding protein